MIKKGEIAALTKDDLIRGDVIQDLYPEVKSGNPDYGEIKRLITAKAMELRCAGDVKRIFTELEKRVKDEQMQERRESIRKRLNGPNGIDYSLFLSFNARGEISGVQQNTVYEYLKANTNIMVFNRKPYVYSNGVYKLDDEGMRTGANIKTKIAELIFPPYRTADVIDKIFRRITGDADLITTKANRYPKSWINFRNGFYDVSTGEWHEHDPKYYSLNQIPWEYHPEEKCEGNLIEDFLNYALYRENARELFLEFAGCAMTPNPNFQNFLMFTGQGGNGKSVLIKLFDALIGGPNLTHLGLTQITSDRFSTVRLLGKLANSCGDLKTESVKDCQKLKMATGGDGLTGEYKGVDSFEFDSYAKLLFSINEIPKIIGEDSDAIFRRMLVLTVDRKPKAVDINLVDKLMKQMPYFVNLCVEACRRLYERGAFIECPDSVSNVENARMYSNSVDAFIADMCEKGPLAKITRTSLYEEYEKYCKEEGKIPKAKTQFYEVLRNKGFEERKSNGKRFILGITVKPTGMMNPEPVKNENVPEFASAPEMAPVQMTIVQNEASGEVRAQGMSDEQIVEQIRKLQEAQEKINQQLQILLGEVGNRNALSQGAQGR